MKKRSPENPGRPENPDESDPKKAGPEYFIDTFAKLNPSDNEFSIEKRLGAFDRALKSSGLSGRIEPKDFDMLYEHYRWEIGLLKHLGNS